MAASNPTITRFARDDTGNFWAVCGDVAYLFPVVSQAAWDALAAKLAPAPTFTNPTPVTPGWEAASFTPDDDVAAALAVGAPDAVATLGPGEYTLKLSVPAPAASAT